MCAILLAFARLPSLALRGRTVGGIVGGGLQLAPCVETVITAAYLHSFRRQNHRRTVAHAEQIHVFTVEARRVHTRARHGGRLVQTHTPSVTTGKVARRTVAEPRTAQPIPPRTVGRDRK